MKNQTTTTYFLLFVCHFAVSIQSIFLNFQNSPSKSKQQTSQNFLEFARTSTSKFQLLTTHSSKTLFAGAELQIFGNRNFKNWCELSGIHVSTRKLSNFDIKQNRQIMIGKACFSTREHSMRRDYFSIFVVLAFKIHDNDN